MPLSAERSRKNLSFDDFSIWSARLGLFITPERRHCTFA
jgi:hypothetical protein